MLCLMCISDALERVYRESLLVSVAFRPLVGWRKAGLCYGGDYSHDD